MQIRYIIMRLKLILIGLMLMSCSFTAKNVERALDGIDLEAVDKKDRPNYELISQVVELAKVELGIPDSVKIILSPLRKALRLQAMGHNAVLKAHVDQINDTTYVISIDPLGDYELIEVVAHEMIHINQYYTKELEKLGGSKVRYKGKRYDLSRIAYSLRMWERDAHYRGGQLGKQIRKAIRELKI